MGDFKDGGRHRNGRSLFGPIMLIGVGVYFLLRNLEIVPSLNWGAAFQLWPLLLIFLGFNIIVLQVRRPLGTLLSGIVSLTAVAVFGAILLFGLDLPLLSRFNLQNTAAYRQETITVPGSDVETADVSINLGHLGAEVYPLTGGSNLLEGTIFVVDDYDLQTRQDGGEAVISLREREQPFGFGSWTFTGDNEPWQLGLSPTIPTDLDIDSGSGTVDLRLGGLLLTNLVVDSGSGAVSLQLPNGGYDIELDSGSGRVMATLPASGQQEMHVRSGSGAVSLFLPPTMAARVDVDSGSGRVSLDGRFTQVQGSGDEDGIWETPNFDPEDPNRLELFIDSGSGAVTIEQPQGR